MPAQPRWEPFDPTWLADLVADQKPGESRLALALRDCRLVFKRSVAYWYFVDASNANQPGSPWQFARNVILESQEHGQLVLDVLKDGRVGGVEFLARVLEVP